MTSLYKISQHVMWVTKTEQHSISFFFYYLKFRVDHRVIFVSADWPRVCGLKLVDGEGGVAPCVGLQEDFVKKDILSLSRKVSQLLYSQIRTIGINYSLFSSA